MPPSTELENFEETNFNWGKKIGRSGELQWYGSFSYDAVDYTLYDCVYMFAQDEATPYIGKLVRIWEDAGGSKKVKIQWFFRPLEISHYLRDMEVADDELFFATGEGTGLSNINPLEAIAGKCNVVCISNDSRNPQPSVEDIQMADYVFYRLFDVKNCLILDKMDDKVGGLDVEFVFNKKASNNIEDCLHSIRTGKESELTNNAGAKGGRPSNINIVSPERKPKSGHDNNSIGLGRAAQLVVDSRVVERKPPKASVFRKGRPFVHDIGHENDFARLGKDAKFAANPCTFDERPSKKVKFDNSVESRDKSNTVQKLEKCVGGDAKKLLKAVGSNEDKTKQRQVNESIRLDKDHPKEACMEKCKISKGKVSKSSAVAPASTNCGRVEGQTFEVTQIPDVAKSTWFNKLPLEERQLSLNDPDKLVLLLNLDPEYTSGEVEGIVWHAFYERCEAKMIPRTAVSSPYCGRAFVLFKKKEAAEKVIQKLDDGCLMLSNGRPLVGCYGALPSVSGRHSSFAGHLVLGDVRRQTQRNVRDAVSTSHCSQANTIEYEMAMDWCLLQSRSDIWWKMLYEGQKEQLRKLSANLKSIEYQPESSFVKEK